MPALTNPRQELFVQKLAEGMSQLSAYAAAGYRCSGPSASALVRKPEIIARRAELLDGLAGRAGVTAEELIEKAKATYELAMAEKQLSAAVAAIREIGVLAGVRVEKRATAIRTINQLSDEELMAIAAGGHH